MRTPLFAALVLILVANPAVAQPVRKWVDDQGKVHYGMQPSAGAKQQPVNRGTMSLPGEMAQEKLRGPYAVDGDFGTGNIRWNVTRVGCRVVSR